MAKLKKRSDGLICRRIYLDNGKAKDIYAHGEKELTQKIKAIQHDLEHGIAAGDKTTVQEWSEEWLRIYVPKLAPTTQAFYTQAYNKHIMPVLAAMPLKDVRNVNIQAVMNSVANQSESLQKNVLATLRRLFNTAKHNRLIEFNPCEGTEITPRRDESAEEKNYKALSDKQRETLVSAVKGTRAELFVNIGLWCGLRREETLGLCWQDIDWGNSVLYVRRTVTFPANDPIESTYMKSKSSKREVPIPPPLMELLNAKNPSHDNTTVLTLHHKNKPDETILVSHIVANTHGEILSKSAYAKMWSNVKDSVNFEITSHMLRHTYCTWLYDNNIDLKTAKDLMGHSDIRITERIYTHIGEKQHRNARAKIQSIFAAPAEKSVK